MHIQNWYAIVRDNGCYKQKNNTLQTFEITHINGQALKNRPKLKAENLIYEVIDDNGIHAGGVPDEYFQKLNEMIQQETPQLKPQMTEIPKLIDPTTNTRSKKTHRYKKPVAIQMTDKIYVFINEMHDTYYYNTVIDALQKNLAQIKQDCDKINKYIDRDVDLTIDEGESIDKYYGHTEPEGNKYFIQAYSDHLDNINRELFHVIDKIGTKNQLSKKKNFKPVIKAYQDFLKTNMIGPYEEEFMFVDSHDYSNGKTQTELFIRLLEHYINKHEGLNVVLFTQQAFDRVVTQFYHDNQAMIDDYFNDTFNNKVRL